MPLKAGIGRLNFLGWRGAAPRDNVVFQAGYFASVKGDDRILIIKESSAKMPADLGGKIYVPMENGELSQSSKLRILTFLREQV